MNTLRSLIYLSPDLNSLLSRLMSELVGNQNYGHTESKEEIGNLAGSGFIGGDNEAKVLGNTAASRCYIGDGGDLIASGPLDGAKPVLLDGKKTLTDPTFTTPIRLGTRVHHINPGDKTIHYDGKGNSVVDGDAAIRKLTVIFTWSILAICMLCFCLYALQSQWIVYRVESYIDAEKKDMLEELDHFIREVASGVTFIASNGIYQNFPADMASTSSAPPPKANTSHHSHWVEVLEHLIVGSLPHFSASATESSSLATGAPKETYSTEIMTAVENSIKRLLEEEFAKLKEGAKVSPNPPPSSPETHSNAAHESGVPATGSQEEHRSSSAPSSPVHAQ